MATFNKFQDFVERLGLATHNLDTAALKVYLSNEAPLATDTVKADIAEISAGNGYSAGGADITGVWTESGGTAQLAATDVTISASGGSIGPFRYIILYNDTDASDRLIGWWDYGSSITLLDGESLLIDFGSTVLTLV